MQNVERLQRGRRGFRQQFWVSLTSQKCRSRGPFFPTVYVALLMSMATANALAVGGSATQLSGGAYDVTPKRAVGGLTPSCSYYGIGCPKPHGGLTPSISGPREEHATTPRRPPITHVIILGQFNYDPCPGCVATWRAVWAKYVLPANIKAVCPSKSTKTALPGTDDCDVYYPQEQRPGHTSPYKNLLHALLDLPDNITGLLYVHDDMVATPVFLARFQAHSWVRSDTLGSVFPGNYRHVSGDSRMPIDLNSQQEAGGKLWHWKKDCEGAAETLPAEKKGYWNSTHPLELVTHQSDMLYIDVTRPHIVLQFVELLSIMAQASMFLECAIPTALEALRKRWGLQVETAALCTSFAGGQQGAARKKYRSWNCTQKEHIDEYELFHPIKLSLYKDWGREWEHIRALSIQSFR